MQSAQIFNRLQQAINNHDIDAFTACFSDRYRSEQPAHPNRFFTGKEQVRKNWTANFQEMPDFHAEVINHTITDDQVWIEWEWKGTRNDKSVLHMAGICLFGISENVISWGRLYMEPVDVAGGNIESAIKEVMGGKADKKE